MNLQVCILALSFDLEGSSLTCRPNMCRNIPDLQITGVHFLPPFGCPLWGEGVYPKIRICRILNERLWHKEYVHGVKSISLPEIGLICIFGLNLQVGILTLYFDFEVSVFACRPDLCRYLPVLKIILGTLLTPHFALPWGKGHI